MSDDTLQKTMWFAKTGQVMIDLQRVDFSYWHTNEENLRTLVVQFTGSQHGLQLPEHVGEDFIQTLILYRRWVPEAVTTYEDSEERTLVQDAPDIRANPGEYMLIHPRKKTA